jgi:hypothetical protein
MCGLAIVYFKASFYESKLAKPWMVDFDPLIEIPLDIDPLFFAFILRCIPSLICALLRKLLFYISGGFRSLQER